MPISVTNVDADTVLVVEDDDFIRDLVRRVLVDLGYHVISAPNGERALDEAVAHAGPVRLVVSDINMPEMGGWNLLERVRGWYPGLRFLLISGEAPSPETMAEFKETPTAFLGKPFTPSQLAEAVKDLFDQPARANTASGSRGQ